MTTDGKHTEEGAPRERERSGMDVSQILRNVFGIFMILVYVAMGIALFVNFFDFKPEFDWVRYVGGTMLILYGIWRGYRAVKGIDQPDY